MKWSWLCHDSGRYSRASHRVQFRSGLVAAGKALPPPSVSVIPPLLHDHSCIYHRCCVALGADSVITYNTALATLRAVIAGRCSVRQSLAFHQRIRNVFIPAVSLFLASLFPQIRHIEILGSASTVLRIVTSFFH
jgi:hypothetical protein